MVGLDFAPIFAITSSSMPLTRSAFGCSLIRHVTSIPSKQSTAGDRYTLPAGIANSLISDKRSSFGFSLWKFLCTSFGTAGLISPLYELYFLAFRIFISRPSSFITLRTIFSETFIPIFLSSTCILRYPYRALLSRNIRATSWRRYLYLSSVARAFIW